MIGYIIVGTILVIVIIALTGYVITKIECPECGSTKNHKTHIDNFTSCDDCDCVWFN